MSQATKAKPRLGRGLSSLISVSSLPVEAEIAPESARCSRVASTPRTLSSRWRPPC